MANGIKLRRGLKATLATTIADGEFVFCSDTGELGFKKGTSEVYVDLKKMTTDIDDLQTNVGELQAKEVSLLPGQFKISVNKFYDFDLNPESKPINIGGFVIPIAKVHPSYIGNEFDLRQLFVFSNANIITYDYSGDSSDFSFTKLSLDYAIIDTQSDGSGGIKLVFNGSQSRTEPFIVVVDDGYGNFSICLIVDIDRVYNTTTHKLRIAFDIDCVSEVGEDQNNNPYNVFLPPLGLEIKTYNGIGAGAT